MAIRIGTSEPRGSFYTQAQALKTVFDRIPSLSPVQVVESNVGASIENAYRLEAGDLELGFISAPWVAAAKKGVPPFSHSIDLKTVAPMNVGPNFFVVRADSALHTLGDLRGKKVAVGLKTSGMTPHAEAVFAAIGLDADDVERVYVNFVDGAELLAGGKVDAQYQCPVPNQIMSELSERIAVRVLAFKPEQFDAALKAIPQDRPTVMRKGAIRGLNRDMPQLGVFNLLMAHTSADEAMVHDVTQAIVDHAGELATLLPLFSGLPNLLETMRAERCAGLQFDGVTLHPGAARVFSASGYL
jgi:TRAP transporter TAXI family solute receptor